MSANENGDNIEQAVANLQRESMAMRQILMLLLAHHGLHSATPNTLSSQRNCCMRSIQATQWKKECAIKSTRSLGTLMRLSIR